MGWVGSGDKKARCVSHSISYSSWPTRKEPFVAPHLMTTITYKNHVLCITPSQTNNSSQTTGNDERTNRKTRTERSVWNIHLMSPSSAFPAIRPRLIIHVSKERSGVVGIWDGVAMNAGLIKRINQQATRQLNCHCTSHQGIAAAN